ncbi:acyltransferase family protein [Herbiconiux sp. UC225_62]|uniref:acyltransferase family protein n=1 Tax=Herbiconiux sp. UC225_62 TaxID=3350168 RepID=UPI0036D36C8B
MLCLMVFDSSVAFPGYWAAAPVISTALILMFGAHSTRFGPSRLLSLRPLLFIGLISYSLYLVHWPALVLPQAGIGYFHPLPLWSTLGIAVLCVPLAWLLFRFVEDPARRTRWLSEARPSKTVLLAAGATLSAAVIGIAGLTVAKVAPMATDTSVAAPVMSVAPDGTAFVPANLSPSLQDAASDKPSIYDDGCHLDFAEVDSRGCTFGKSSDTVIALFGDSHAAQWFPALKAWVEEKGYTLETHTKSSCPSIELEIKVNGVPFENCEIWRDGVIDHLRQSPPSLVILANFYHTVGSEDPDAWSAALRRSLVELTQFNVVMLADTPYMGQNPSICLSANLTNALECSRPRSEAMASPIREAEVAAASETGTPLIDLNSYFCSNLICPPIVGNVAVYRDPHHVSSVFSEFLASP